MSVLRIMMVLMLLSCALVPCGLASETDEIDAKVQAARKAYEAESAAILADVAKELDAREAAERKRAKPDLERIKGIKAEREELDQWGKIPPTVSSKFKSRIKKNSTTFIGVLTAAKSDYIKAKLDSEAEALESELNSLKADTQPAPAKESEDKAAEKTADKKPPSKATTNKTAAAKKPLPGVKWKGWPKNAPPLANIPFDAEQARKHQAAWAKYVKRDVEYENSIGMKFVLIPPGEFLMGSTDEEVKEALQRIGDFSNFAMSFKSELPQHKVILSHPYYLSVHEVTQAQFQRVMGVNPSYYAKTGKGSQNVGDIDTRKFPVETTGWSDAAAFCMQLSLLEKVAPAYACEGEKVAPLDGNGYRIPSEAEWEFACRAGTTTKYWCGDNNDDLKELGLAWLQGNHPQAVGQVKANPFGVCDLAGNIREWTEDFFEPTWYSQLQSGTSVNPRCPQFNSKEHVVRGGYFGDQPVVCRSSARISRGGRGYDIGFRVMLPVSAVK